jgi:hypothetical protein
MKNGILLSLRESVADPAFTRLENLKQSKEGTLNQLATEIEKVASSSNRLSLTWKDK